MHHSGIVYPFGRCATVCTERVTLSVVLSRYAAVYVCRHAGRVDRVSISQPDIPLPCVPKATVHINCGYRLPLCRLCSYPSSRLFTSGRSDHEGRWLVCVNQRGLVHGKESGHPGVGHRRCIGGGSDGLFAGG